MRKAKVLVTKQEGDYMRELASKGYTQHEIARMTCRSQSCVNYQTSKGRFKRCDYNRARYRIDRCGGINMKMVIFRRNGNLYMTNEENYNAIIEDAHKVTSLKDFDTFDQVVAYMCEHSHAIPEQFIDRTGD